MTCKCRTVKCSNCNIKMVPKHSLGDKRRYCTNCGYNLGITKCKGYDFAPICHICQKEFINDIDTITNKKSKYLFKPSCKCYKKDFNISVG